MDMLELLGTTALWVIHCLLLVFISADVARRGTAAKYVATLYIFYTLTLLVPFYQHEHFDYVIDYVPSIPTLFMGVCADASMIAALRLAFRDAVPAPDGNGAAMSASTRTGFQLLVAVAALAQLIDIGLNRELLLLPKELYIEAEKTPNLLVFSIPASLILLGGALYSPYRSRAVRAAVALLAAVAVTLSVIQGYRGVALMVVLYLVYRRWPGTWPAVPAVLMTVAGELSNPLKYLVGSLFLNENFDAASMFSFYAENTDALFGLSGEQKAIVSNLVIGLNDLALGLPVLELRNLFPFTNQLFGNITVTSASRLGELSGAGFGQGTGYSYVLFIAESLFLAPLFLILAVRLIRLLANTPLTFVSWTIFFSLMRDTPAFWTGELKMLMLLTGAIFAVSWLFPKIFGAALARPADGEPAAG